MVAPVGSRYPVGYTAGMARKIDPDEYIRVGTAAKLAGVTI